MSIAAKSFVIQGFGCLDPRGSYGDLPSFDLNAASIPGSPEKAGVPSEEVRAAISALAPKILKSILASGADTVVVRSGRELSTATTYTMILLRKMWPSLKIVVADDTHAVGSSIRTLRSRVSDFVVRTSSVETVVRLLPSLFADPRSIVGPKVFWRTDDGLTEWNRPFEKDGADVLLVILPAWSNDFAPFGIAHVSSALKSAGFKVKVLDLNCSFWAKMQSRFEDSEKYENIVLWSTEDRYRPEVRPFLESTFEELRKAIAVHAPKYVGFSVFNTNRLVTEDACAMIKRESPHVKLFGGGPSCTASWSHTMLARDGGMDGVVFGEGELTAIDLLESWRDGDDRAVPGAWKKLADSSIVKGPTRPLADMTKLPAPDFDGFPVYDYKDFTLPIFFGRGCVAKCTFCAETAYWKKFRLLSPESILDSIGRAISEYGITNFQVNDSLMNGSHKILEQIADGIIERGYDIQFVGYCRLEDRLSRDLLRKLARAGCESIFFGMESGSQKVIDLMKKGVKVENYERILRDAHEAGIRCTACVVVGFPGETWLDFLKTARAFWRFSRYLDNVNLSILEIPEGTPLAEDMAKFGVEFTPQGPIRAWRSADKSNTLRVRYARYRILSGLWKWLKRRKVSPDGWNFEYENPTAHTPATA